MQKKIILTGDRPSGKLHLGHFCGSLKNRIKLQDEYDQFIIVADVQALSANFGNPEQMRSNIVEIVLDYLAVGIDPEKTTIFLQSMIPEIAELTVFFMNLVTVARLERNPTVKEELRNKGLDSNTVGFFSHPISQAADITIFDANLVPVGQDQAPLLEQTCEIVDKFNRIYGQTLVRPEIMIPETGGRLPGIDGNAKMSKSLGNAIYLSDEPGVLKEKVMRMYTDPNHINVQDPGKIEGNVVFNFLDVFSPNKIMVEDLKAHYQQGGLGDVKVKTILFDTLEEIIAPIRQRRKVFEADKAQIFEILKIGTKKARTKAALTMERIKRAMGIDFFS